ncbi:MAG TPA: hypothetical protein VFP50_10020 [Anaeromyxobacteraceae bacterium]|nr:hypothetical protein [Anaeromyxobacteraceae bacterium]
MFTPEPSIQFVPATREQVVALIEGINQPQVSIPGKAPQSVSAHLCGLRNANGSFSIFVGLHLPKSGENVIYLHGKRQLTAEEYRAVQDEGLHFLESMGFMLDNLNYRNMAAALQDETLKRIPLFWPPRAAGAAEKSAADKTAAEAGRVARLLASF